MLYCLNSEIIFIRIDQVGTPTHGWESTDPFERFAQVARDAVAALRGLPVSGVMMVSRNIDLPVTGSAVEKALGRFYEMEKLYPNKVTG